jgi:hypothetical protein
MKDILHALHTSPHKSPVADGAYLRRKWRRKEVEASDLMFQVSQSADKGLTEVTCAACNQNSHTRLPRRQSNPDHPSFRGAESEIQLRRHRFKPFRTPTAEQAASIGVATAKNHATCRFFDNPPDEGIEHKPKYRHRKADKTATRPYQIVVAKYRDRIKGAKYASCG